MSPGATTSSSASAALAALPLKRPAAAMRPPPARSIRLLARRHSPESRARGPSASRADSPRLVVVPPAKPKPVESRVPSRLPRSASTRSSAASSNPRVTMRDRRNSAVDCRAADWRSCAGSTDWPKPAAKVKPSPRGCESAVAPNGRLPSGRAGSAVMRAVLRPDRSAKATSPATASPWPATSTEPPESRRRTWPTELACCC